MNPISKHAVAHAPHSDDQQRAVAHCQSTLEELRTRLHEWFGMSFDLFDGTTGDLLAPAEFSLASDAGVLSELCRAVANSGRAEIVEDHDPLLVLALPVQLDAARTVVATAPFMIRASILPRQLEHVAARLNVSLGLAQHWIAEQQVWRPNVLLNLGQLATERLAAEARLRAVDREMRELTLNLSTTYEEISLIYRLTQNLKLGCESTELARLALEGLSEVVKAEGLAVLLLPTESDLNENAEAVPDYLTYGDCPLSSTDVATLLRYCSLEAGKRPFIANEAQTGSRGWPWPQARQVIAVSLCEGSNCFGWLLAMNHTDGAEFGTVEASLLSSVAAILGIHGGNAELYHQQRELFKGIVRVLTSAIDAKDPYTCGHSDRVARVSVKLAEAINLSPQQIETIYLAGLLHDIGKIGIDDNVLRKPGKLTDAEYEHIKTHVVIGHRILSKIDLLEEVLPVVLHHHEQWNGRGYPSQLAGESIPLMARIMAVADAYDAMSSDRPYRQGMPDEKLDAIFRQGSGEQWDPRIVEAFFRVRDEMRAITSRTTSEPDVREFV